MSLVLEVHSALRERLLFQEINGGYTLDIRPASASSVRVKVGMLKGGIKHWKETDLFSFIARRSTDIDAVLAKHLPDAPRCKCGCGLITLRANVYRNGHHQDGLELGGLCFRGHVLTKDVLGTRSSGYHYCRLCARENFRAWAIRTGRRAA